MQDPDPYRNQVYGTVENIYSNLHGNALGKISLYILQVGVCCAARHMLQPYLELFLSSMITNKLLRDNPENDFFYFFTHILAEIMQCIHTIIQGCLLYGNDKLFKGNINSYDTMAPDDLKLTEYHTIPIHLSVYLKHFNSVVDTDPDP